MTEDDWKPLRELGFDDRACLEVAHIVGIFNYLTRLADGFGLRLDAPVAKASRAGVALRPPSTTTGSKPRIESRLTQKDGRRAEARLRSRARQSLISNLS